MREKIDEQLLNRYLLEDLSDEERERLEEGYLTDDDLYMKFMVAEDELIAAYVQGELSRGDRAKFEQAYLTNPHRLQKVESTRELLNFFAEKSTPPAPHPGFLTSLLQRPVGGGWRTVYALSGLLLLAASCVLSCWLLVERWRIQGELEAARERLRQTESEKQRLLTAQTPTPTPVEEPEGTPVTAPTISKPEQASGTGEERKTQGQRRYDQRVTEQGGNGKSASSSVLAFALPRPGVRTRGGGGGDPATEPLVIPRGIVLVRLSVKVPSNEYAAYRLSLQKLGGSEVWRQTVPKNVRGASGERVSIELPASLLMSGDYILKVMGEDEILALQQITVAKQDAARK